MANAAGSGGKSAARLKRRNESKMIMRQPIMLISILTVIVLLLLFVVYPLVKVLLFSLTDETGAFSLATAAEIFSTSRYLKTFGRTMVLGVIVAVIATFIGYIFAYVYNNYLVHRDKKRALADYTVAMSPVQRGAPASACVNCGKCLEKCPQKLKIPELLKRVRNDLGF